MTRLIPDKFKFSTKFELVLTNKAFITSCAAADFFITRAPTSPFPIGKCLGAGTNQCLTSASASGLQFHTNQLPLSTDDRFTHTKDAFQAFSQKASSINAPFKELEQITTKNYQTHEEQLATNHE